MCALPFNAASSTKIKTYSYITLHKQICTKPFNTVLSNFDNYTIVRELNAPPTSSNATPGLFEAEPYNTHNNNLFKP